MVDPMLRSSSRSMLWWKWDLLDWRLGRLEALEDSREDFLLAADECDESVKFHCYRVRSVG